MAIVNTKEDLSVAIMRGGFEFETVDELVSSVQLLAEHDMIKYLHNHTIRSKTYSSPFIWEILLTQPAELLHSWANTRIDTAVSDSELSTPMIFHTSLTQHNHLLEFTSTIPDRLWYLGIGITTPIKKDLE